MSLGTYDEPVDTAAVDAAIAAAEADIQQGGKLHSAEDVFASLRRKHLKSDD